MHIVTGGAGFIGSAFVAKLNNEGISNIVIVDDLQSDQRWLNLRNLKYTDIIGSQEFLKILDSSSLLNIKSITHMGACSSTTEKNVDFLLNNNYNYTRTLAKYSIENDIRFLYASSAATYGNGEEGYVDFQDEESLLKLKPLNPYGFSKHLFDLWASRNNAFKKIVGLKFFNVFGPNEYHKGEMASMIKKSYEDIKATGKIHLFKSYKDGFKDGEQLRDFVYIKDVVDAMWKILNKKEITGLYNIGTSKARSWNDLANSVFHALNMKPNIEYVEMPLSIRNQYQYFTEANIQKLNSLNLDITFRSLEDAVSDYVQNYLDVEDKYLK